MKSLFSFVLLACANAACAAASGAPDVSQWRRAVYDEAFFQGRAVCGQEALDFWMQSSNWRGNRDGIPEKYSQLERLLGGDTQQVARVNRDLAAACGRVLADVTGWRTSHPHSRDPAMWMTLALRAPDRLTAETHRAIRDALAALDLSGRECGYTGYMGTPGANGANVHGYLTPLVLAPALIDDPKVRAAGEQALRTEIACMNGTGDFPEYNLLESHWNGTASWEVAKRFIPDPHLRRMARMISERLWINRFLTWSPAVERITGPGSRMAPSEWLGCDNERALLATGMSRPVWINFFFPWDGWDPRAQRGGWPLQHLEALVPDLPAYLQDLAWRKSVPNELQCMVRQKHWKNYPRLEGVAEGDQYRPMKYVNYQTENYTLGSASSSFVVNTCVVGLSAWWNNSRNAGAPLGSPARFCVLYPHYVVNGMSFLDKGDLCFTNKSEPLKDDKGGVGGPYLREFIEFGRMGIVQDRNTLIASYTSKPGTHHGELAKDKVQRASAGMFLFRWTDGTDGLFVNREPVRSLPRELAPGDVWFIEDGDVFAAVRPLQATRLRGDCRTVLEKRTRHVVLYQDNVAAENIEGISNEDWVKARSGFVVEMGNRQEYGSFAKFQDRVLGGKVAVDAVDGFERHVAYERDDRKLEMKWHCYSEEYASRQTGGREDPWPRFLQSPGFAVGDGGSLGVKAATLRSTAGKTLWLLACEPSKTWVAYQPNVDEQLPLSFECPAGRLTCERFPFGKVAVTQTPEGGVLVDVDASPAPIRFETKARTVQARINGSDCKVAAEDQDGHRQWIIHPQS